MGTIDLGRLRHKSASDEQRDGHREVTPLVSLASCALPIRCRLYPLFITTHTWFVFRGSSSVCLNSTSHHHSSSLCSSPSSQHHREQERNADKSEAPLGNPILRLCTRCCSHRSSLSSIQPHSSLHSTEERDIVRPVDSNRTEPERGGSEIVDETFAPPP